MSQSLDIPVDVPWSLVAASPDMMDTTFCDGGFPPPWRSSLAIYAYEPSVSDLPKQLCNQRITYLKVTCSLTGFQPTAAEAASLAQLPAGGHLTDQLPDVPADVPEDLNDPYFACYGVLLNVAVVPSTTTVPETPPIHHTYSFAQREGSLPNPFSDAGLLFSSSIGPNLFLKSLPRNGPMALVIESTQLRIDLPISTNVVLRMSIAESAKGTITAYQGDATVSSSPLVPATGVQDVAIDTVNAVTHIVIDETGDGCLLAGLSYDGGVRDITLGDYPHIIDFEPKTRDLYQAATDQGEILTASGSGVNTGKSLSNTTSSEMGLGVNVSGGYAAGAGGGGNLTVGGQLTSQWGSTASDASNTQVDQSRERRETQGTTTNITQQYNILTGYHAGTNRAAFLMLPRPHTLQATDYRTFVRGLRMIEGVQEFLLIVARPAALPGICIEASLETGHFPEDVALAPPPPPTTLHQEFPFTIGALAPGNNAIANNFDTNQAFALPPGWTIDNTKGDPGTPGLSVRIVPTPPDTASAVEFLQALASKSVTSTVITDAVAVRVHINSHGFDPFNTTFSESAAACQFLFTVYGTQVQPPPADKEPVVVSPFLVTSRELCACIRSGLSNDCLTIGPPHQTPYGELASAAGNSGMFGSYPRGGGLAPSAGAGAGGSESGAANVGAAAVTQRVKPGRSSIVYEAKVTLPPHLLEGDQLRQSRTPASRELMHQVQYHLLTSWRRPGRRPHNAVGFLDSDYVCERMAKRLSDSHLSRQIADVPDLPDGVVTALGGTTSVGEVLTLELHRFGSRARVGLEEAMRIRRILLGLGDEEPGDTTV